MKIINFRVTEEEKEALQKKADTLNISVSEYCRRLSFNYKIENTIPAQIAKELIELWQELKLEKIPSEKMEKLKNIILKIEL